MKFAALMTLILVSSTDAVPLRNKAHIKSKGRDDPEPAPAASLEAVDDKTEAEDVKDDEANIQSESNAAAASDPYLEDDHRIIM